MENPSEYEIYIDKRKSEMTNDVEATSPILVNVSVNTSTNRNPICIQLSFNGK